MRQLNNVSAVPFGNRVTQHKTLTCDCATTTAPQLVAVVSPLPLLPPPHLLPNAHAAAENKASLPPQQHIISAVRACFLFCGCHLAWQQQEVPGAAGATPLPCSCCSCALSTPWATQATFQAALTATPSAEVWATRLQAVVEHGIHTVTHSAQLATNGPGLFASQVLGFGSI